MANTPITPPAKLTPLPNWESIERGYDATLVHPMTLGEFVDKDGNLTGTLQPVLALTLTDANPVTLTAGGQQYSTPVECDVTVSPTFEAASSTSTSVIQASSDIASAVGNSIKFGADDGDGLTFGCSSSAQITQKQSSITGRQSVLGATHATVGVYQMKLTQAPALSPAFLTALGAVTSPDDVVNNVIPAFGTHYATSVSLGGLAELIYTVVASDLSNFTSKSVDLKSDVSGSFGGLSGDATLSSNSSVSDTFTSAASYKTGTINTAGGDESGTNTVSIGWQPSVSTKPAPIAVTLQPLYLLPQLTAPKPPVTADQIDALTKGIAQYLRSPGRVPLSASIMNYQDAVVLQPVTGIAPSGNNLVSQPGILPSGSTSGVQSIVAVPPAARQLTDLAPGGTLLDQAEAGLQLTNPTDSSPFLLTLIDPSNPSNTGQVDYTKPLCFKVLNSSPGLVLDSSAANPGRGLVGLSANADSALAKQLSTQWTVTPLYDATQPPDTENAYATLSHGEGLHILVHGDPVSIKRVAPVDPKYPNSKQGYLMALNGKLTSGGDYRDSGVTGNSCYFRLLLVEKGNS